MPGCCRVERQRGAPRGYALLMALIITAVVLGGSALAMRQAMVRQRDARDAFARTTLHSAWLNAPTLVAAYVARGDTEPWEVPLGTAILTLSAGPHQNARHQVRVRGVSGPHVQTQTLCAQRVPRMADTPTVSPEVASLLEALNIAPACRLAGLQGAVPWPADCTALRWDGGGVLQPPAANAGKTPARLLWLDAPADAYLQADAPFVGLMVVQGGARVLPAPGSALPQVTVHGRLVPTSHLPGTREVADDHVAARALGLDGDPQCPAVFPSPDPAQP